MCFINWWPEDHWQNGNPEPTPYPRPRPRLAWAIPVDVVELGTSLIAYGSQLPMTTALRLCHRFGGGAFSRLPQEVLDHIIDDAHQAERTKIRPEWDRRFSCFQDKCLRGSHYHNHNIDGQTRTSYDAEEALTDIEYYRDSSDDSDEFNENVCETHFIWREEWLEMVCLCRRPSNSTQQEPNFAQLNILLKSHFGLEAIILHEAFSQDLQNFLPYIPEFGDGLYYTSCFLALSPGTQDTSASRRCSSTHQNASFLRHDNHLAFHQVIDLARLGITKSQKTYFARAMRVLGLNLSYHLTELESVVKPSTQDKLLWEICHLQLSGCPKPTTKHRLEKMRKLEHYITSKSEDLAKESWPKLMNIASSDVVSPIESSMGAWSQY